MSFWKLCEELSGRIGMDDVILHIDLVFRRWMEGSTVDEIEKEIEFLL